MPSTLRLARTFAAVAIALAAFACGAAWHHQWVVLVLFTYGAAVAYVGSRLEYHAQRRIRAEAERAERMARPYHPEPPPLSPCCRLWVQSHGEVHDGQRCTRPLAARTQLSLAERDAFAAITSSLGKSRDDA